MKTILTILCIFVGLFIFTSAAVADLRFEQITVKLGKVRSGLPLKHHFHFINSGQETVEIVDVRAGCGCLVPRLQKKIFAPGEKGSIPLEVNTLAESAGPHRWYVYLQYRAGKEEKLVPLQLLAEVETEVTMQPAKVTLYAGTAVEQELRLTDLRSKPLTITALRCTSSHLKITAGQRGRNALGHWVVEIRVQPTESFPAGRHEEFLHIDTDDPVYQELKIPITVIKRAGRQLSARPEKVDISGSRGQALPSQLILVRSSENKPVVIDKIECEHPAVSWRWAKGPGSLATVRVQVDKDRLEESFRSTIHIHVAEPMRDVLSIPISCRLTPPIAANPGAPGHRE